MEELHDAAGAPHAQLGETCEVLSIAIYPGYSEAPGHRVVCSGGQERVRDSSAMPCQDGRLMLSRRGLLAIRCMDVWVEPWA